ncbi:hypothetical protein [Thalassomonas actiniarum]|uniref:Uncharacterized protein n=1 Tax=Thalassomonas actiniarum TaxID=485447 RepID=A0AAE9YTS1_9GAMM|nr:hypothetical protein [Thalassomonas actiniarum]WDE00125.1 hypothetical protein SG35_005580 [Thalassomonas actiniarum]
MSRVKVIRKGNGDAFKDKQGRYVFVKDGVHFALSHDHMEQLVHLVHGLNDGSLLNIDPSSPDMAKGD